MTTVILFITLPLAIAALSILGRHSIGLRVLCVTIFVVLTYVALNTVAEVSARVTIEKCSKGQQTNSTFNGGAIATANEMKERIPLLMGPVVVLAILSLVPTRRKERPQPAV